jgi:hypothetical protein
MKLIIIELKDQSSKFSSFNWGVNKGEKLEFRAKMVKFANQ